MKIGAHESIARGLHLAFDRAEADGCAAVQIFSKNQNRWAAAALKDKDIAAWRRRWAQSPDVPVLVHDSYLINLCAPDAEKRERSLAGFVDEMERCAQLGIPHLVFHPGSHLGQGEEWGCREVARSLDHCVETARDAESVRLLVETTAGQGTNLGWRFEHLRDIVAACRYPERLGVCVDTCHVHAAGYDWTTEEGYARTLAELDACVGLARVEAFHLNDSQRDPGARVDRHARIDEGTIGREPFARLVNDARFADTPAVLETPAYEDGTNSFADGIRLLNSLRS